ncbi:MAG TPA: SH3 domain-containing protein [Anaerolineae bacterium]|nr:SH3 domain-containing protein [Anaerolineae bacterium]
MEKEGECCVLQRPYTATELNVEEGETVTVLLMESGWGWVTNESGQSGWVPLENLAQVT